MKRFRFATIHLVMIGLILFGILAICVRLFQTESAILAAIFLALSLLVALLYYQKETYELSELEQIELLKEQNKELKDANDQSKSELKKSKCLNVFMAIIAFLTLVATVVFGFVTLLMK